MSAEDPNIGRKLVDNQFEILEKIGSGGMGSVYKAFQSEMNRMVGVKILHSKLTNRKDITSRFRREARAMSHLTHPNTVKVFLYGELDDGSLYIVMEYLEGKNLNQLVRRQGPLALERAISILLQVCGALEEAHDRGIIHRDLKPENIFVTTSGRIQDFAKVLDFGLAKVTENEMRPGSIMLTQEGMVFGTPEFMSPEQAEGKPLDGRSDIYALATILYEALTGKLPFEAKTPMDYIQCHIMNQPIRLSERVVGKTFPRQLDDIIEKALSKEVEDRFQKVGDFAEALRPFAGNIDPEIQLLLPKNVSSSQKEKVDIPWDTRAESPTVIANVAHPMSLPTSQPESQTIHASQTPQRQINRKSKNELPWVTFLIVAFLFLVLGIVIAVVTMKFIL